MVPAVVGDSRDTADPRTLRKTNRLHRFIHKASVFCRTVTSQPGGRAERPGVGAEVGQTDSEGQVQVFLKRLPTLFTVPITTTDVNDSYRLRGRYRLMSQRVLATMPVIRSAGPWHHAQLSRKEGGMSLQSGARTAMFVTVLVGFGVLVDCGPNWLAAQPSPQPPAQRSSHGDQTQTGERPLPSADQEFLDLIRARIGSVVPPEGLGGDSKRPPHPAAPPSDANADRLSQLPPEDDLTQNLRQLVAPVEQRARQEAARGHWELAIRLHQIAVLMQAVGGAD